LKPRQRLLLFTKKSRRGLSGDVNHDKAMKSCRYQQAWFGLLPGYNKGPLEKSSGPFHLCLLVLARARCRRKRPEGCLSPLLAERAYEINRSYRRCLSKPAASHLITLVRLPFTH
jgi:hypothetical protein